MGEEDFTSTVIFVNFCSFAKVWLIPEGSVQKSMVVYYFRQFYPHAYKYQEQATDEEIERCLEEWNKLTVKADRDETGMYIGFQLNYAYEKELKEKEKTRHKIQTIKAILQEAKRTGKTPPMKVLKLAAELGVIRPKSGAAAAAEEEKSPDVKEEAAAPAKKTKKTKKAAAGDAESAGTTKKVKKVKKKKGKDTSLTGLMAKGRRDSVKNLGQEDVESVVVFKRGSVHEDDPEEKAKAKAPVKKKTTKKKVAKKKAAA